MKTMIEEAKAWRKRKIKDGWEDTPDGLLPMIEIKKAGYALSERGEWKIPAEEHIADGNHTRQAGEKFVAPTRQYMRWKREREIKINNLDTATRPTIKQLNFTKEEEPDTFNVPDDDIDVSKIPF